jgi:hypothetical protein
VPRIFIESGVAGNVVKRKLAAPLRRELGAVGRQMTKDAVGLMEGDYDLERPYERRRYPGSRRAKSALDFQIQEDGDGEFTLGFRVLGGEDVLKRIIFMNWGTRPHQIWPSGNWELTGIRGGITVRSGARPTGGAGSGRLAWTDENGQVVIRGHVDHPGQSGTGFLQDARDLAVENLKRSIAG